MKERGYRLVGNLVNYYSPEDFHGSFRGSEAAFNKQERFSWQREYRFAIDSGTEGNEALNIELGDLRDIAKPFNALEVNRALLGGELRIVE